MALGMDSFNEVMNPGSADAGILPGPGSGPPWLKGGDILGGLVPGIGGLLKGNYDPQNMLMEKLGIQQPGWMKSLNAIRNMGGIGFSNGKGWFGMQQGGGQSQNMLMGVLAQQMGQGQSQGGDGQSSESGPITVKNDSSLTPMPGGARAVNPISYREGAMLPPTEFNRLTQY